MRALLTAVLVAFIGLSILQYWELLVFAVLFGTFDAVFTPAIMAITPEIVPDDLLSAMNSLRPLSNNLIGPAVGGVLAAWSTSFAIGVDCATFIVSAGALVSMKPTPAPDRKAGASMIDDVREGPRYVRDTR
jgi:DHA3 family macrolide efflux protein-like MFS transporter